MVKHRPATKPASAPNAKRHKPNPGNPVKTGKPAAAAAAAAARQAVDPTKLAWSTVHLPSEAQAGGAGVTESDFFDSLNWDDDDFMGLQEIDDVDVVQQSRPDGSRTISFLASDRKLKNKQKQQITAVAAASTSSHSEQPKTKETKKQKAKKSNKRSIDQVAPHVESDVEAEAEVEQAEDVELDEQEDAEPEEADSDAYQTAADVTIAEEAEESDLDDDDLAEAFRNAHRLDLQDDEDEDDEFDDSSLPAWSHLPLHADLKRALAHKGFAKPTEIQNRSLPLALGLQQTADSSDQASESDEAAASTSQTRAARRRDVVGVSQTGSGKTLAYGLPILNYLFENAENVVASSAATTSVARGEDEVPPPLGALIVCPTRELALQVSAHLTDIVRASCLDADGAVSHRKLLRRPQIAVVCGGMSEHKQRRLLDGRSRGGERRNGVDIIVATPGRLWELTRLDDHLAARIKQTRFLVLDEADRMVEVGHFAEMEHILNLVNRSEAVRPSEGKDGQNSDDEEQDGVEAHGVRPNAGMQTLIFSATLSKALQVNLKRRRRVQQFTKKRHAKRAHHATTLDELMDRIDFRDAAAAIVDLSSAQGLPEGLVETKLECVGKDKDLYLYYFLLRYPGRSLVFVNSIDGIRRLTPLLAQLNITAYPIHSQLQQKQRLKNLDRFRSFDRTGKVANCVLLATDVAARGLDIPSVEHVVHYQLPRSADTYVHRSGRTARAGSSGVALALIEPKEKSLWSQLCRTLGRNANIATLPVTFSTLALLRERVELAVAIDKAMHEAKKQAHDQSWLAQLAEEADLAMSDDDVDPDAPVAAKKGGRAQGKVEEMRARLAASLAKPVTTRGISHRYLTATGLQGSGWVDDMISNTNHEQFVGVHNTDAQTDIQSKHHPASSKASKATAPPQKPKTAKNGKNNTANGDKATITKTAGNGKSFKSGKNRKQVKRPVPAK